MIPRHRLCAVVSKCTYCECKIYENEDYYSFSDGDICENCIGAYLKDHKILGG